ncbi:SDR family NAD(P)-dependent oxidoreductase [Fulvimonas soli]|jgi:NAD(P)-dependent dehydrogenase (short-subunit alcohol dehydrogenase family)|uniref:Short-subunit dehydrogenase n=1 Tax=Fulvimonas soli TaxID=155197 RepID=A0A316IZB7_9GAMM|nr:SDR family NAD(P)-dependent oxidoreductase [Fulvimonas soli]PWK92585.1 short-subunit dehydrogenase [Fulvimonas soli]TNY27791.1 short-chain dehydrogenase [Fulvimonas soli]
MNGSPRRAPRALAPPLAQQVALVSGGNRGLGLEVARQLAATGMSVLLGARRLADGERAARELRREGGDVRAVKLDVASDGEATAAAALAERQFGRLDVLVNNAAGFYDAAELPAGVALDTVRAALETNLLGAWRLAKAALPLMRRHGHGRIVNVSSGCGASGVHGPEAPAYRVSKAALNAFTRALAAELLGSGVLVNAVCPGWVATAMGGPGGRPVAEGAAGIVWAACLPEGGPSGQFFRDRQRIAW